MHLARKRSLAAGLILALLLSIAGIGAPAVAGPAPWPTPHLGGRDTPTAAADLSRTFDYPSLKFWRDEIKWDSPKLATSYLNGIKAHAAYKGQVGSEGHLLSAWKDYALKKGIGPWEKLTDEQKRDAWEKYLTKYITPQDNNAKGAAYADLYVQAYQLGQAGYLIDQRFPGLKSKRRGDAFTAQQGGVLFEFKSGVAKIDRAQARFLAQQALRMGKTLAYVFGDTPDPDDLAFLESLSEELSPGNSLIQHFRWPAVAKPVRHPNAPPPPATPGGAPAPTPPTSPSGAPGSLAAEGQHVEDTSATDAIADSPSSKEDAAATAELQQELAQEMGFDDPTESDVFAQPLGGVDFSTLELRYVSDTYGGALGTGVQYAYKVDTKPGEAVSFGGRESAQLAADSFFTWLTLPPSSFTVNLNPDEPNRIIDAKFGKTDAGRVLLEADLTMKKSVAKFIHPDTKQGQAFWDALHGEAKCLSMRQWIVPRPAVVRENGNELFIIDAPLEVKMEGEYFKTKGAASDVGCDKQSTSDTNYNEALYRSRILPQVEKAVNTTPEYADLRRVYASRVAAEWYRQRSKTKTTAYSKLVDSGDASAWPLREKWSPMDTFTRYVKSFKDGEFKVERKTTEGNYIVTHIYVYGGVDLTNIPEKRLGAAEFSRTRPALDSTVAKALSAPRAEQGQSLTWLGGRSTQRPPWSPQPLPTSPLRMPIFYVLVTLPVLLWLGLGAFIGVRRRRRPVAVTA
jgi:hypothetical protein